MTHVEIYSTPTCTYCKVAKRFFSEHNVKYTEYDVADDESKAEEMFKKSGQSAVPVIDIDGHIIVGYDKRAIKEALHME